MSTEQLLCQLRAKRGQRTKDRDNREKRDPDQRMYVFQERKGQYYQDSEYIKLLSLCVQ